MSLEKHLKLSTIAVGGMGYVYRGKDYSGQFVCHKEAKPKDSHPNSGLFLMREGTILSKLDHPAIPRVIESYVDITGDENIEGVSMEYIEGEMLGDRPLSEMEAGSVALQVLDVLDYLHNFSPRPIYHLDIKPNNLIRKKNGRVYVIDFGVAAVEGEKLPRPRGTPGSMAPEIFLGSLGPHCDIYSVGTLIPALLTGEIPGNLFDTGLSVEHAKSLFSPFNNRTNFLEGKEETVNASSPMKKIIRKLTRQNPNKRPKTAKAAKRLLEGAGYSVMLG